ncbi:MAG: hypothetical protein J6U54_11165 [Clostridiales bacterium]|nr:hypothetical protein [Clostridiales bacterium]
MDGLTASDAIALRNNDGGFMGDGMGAFWIFALLLLNNNGWGGNNKNYVTEGELAASQQGQTNNLMLSNLQQQVAGSQYATAQAINDQTNFLMQQNNTNLVNAIQGFNNIGLQITNQTNQLSSQLQQMSAQMNDCCCSIKTQMLQNRLDDANAKIVEQRNEISNLQQTQTILNTLGRFVAWSGNGSQGGTAAAAG